MDLITKFDPLGTLVRLDAEARNMTPLPRSLDSMRLLNQADGQRMVGMSRPTDPADLHPEKWEMHPDGDELLFLMEGAIDIEMDAPQNRPASILPMLAGEACLVPKGVWHRLLLRAPALLMFITPTGGTRMRPYGKAA